MPEQQNITNIPSNRVEFIDSRTGLVSREWYRFFLNLFNLAGAGGNQTSLDDLQIGPPPQPDSGGGGGGGTGTVTSVDVSGGTTGLTTTGGPVTSSGTITLGGTLNVANGGTGADNATTARVNLVAAKSGANSDITSMSGITGGISTPDYIDFDTAATVTRASGRLWWDNADGIQTLNLGMAGTNATMQVGQESYYRIKASSDITEGQVVMFTGTVGASGALKGAPATGLTAATAQYVMGVATESIALNSWGYVTEFGLVRGIDTSGGAEAWVDGQILYYNPSVAGGLTKTLPSAPNAKVVVAAVVYAHATNGSLFIRPSFGGELGQYEGNVGFTTLSNGDLMQYDSGSGKWTNVPSSTFGTGSVTSVGTAGTVNGLTLTGGPITTSGTVTLGGTLDLSSPPTIGNTTPNTGAFTTLSASSTVSGAGFSTYLASPPAIGGTAPAAGTFTTLTATGQTSLGGATAVESLRVNTTGGSAGSNNYVDVYGTFGSGDPLIASGGTGANAGLGFRIKGTGAYKFATANTSSNVQFQVSNTASAVNYVQVTGAATTKATVVSSAGSDSNISSVFQSKGTGAIDLAAGSSGVNISNGGTVTAITVTAGGNTYTSIPTPAITAPTTAGGVQATATANMLVGASNTVASGGTGYTLNDTLTAVGGTFTSAATFTVTGVSGGVVTSVSNALGGTYSALPTNPISVTGGTGTGCTINVNSWSMRSLNITNAGSGYVEQPTVTFSGGGGSGAAAYATVGSGTVVKSIGSTMSFYTPGGEALRVTDSGVSTTAYWNAQGSGTSPRLTAVTSSSGVISTSSATPLIFQTNGTTSQFYVAHTASAVNYVQVTGAATGSGATISTQGSDANVRMILNTKGGSSGYDIQMNSARQVFISGNGSAVNYLQIGGAAAGSAPFVQSQGNDTNIDLTLTPKGTGVVRTSGTGIRLYGSSSGYVGLTGAAAAGSTTYTLPSADGTSGQALSTNGSGTLSWATPASSNVTAQGLWENSATISSNYSITSGNNALSSGPVTIATGVTVTVPSGSVWSIV